MIERLRTYLFWSAKIRRQRQLMGGRKGREENATVECKLLVDELQSKFRTDLIYIVALLVVVVSHLARHDKFLVPMMHFSVIVNWP